MTILKLTKSGRGVQVVDDFGNLYQVSKSMLERFLVQGNVEGVLYFTRMPVGLKPDRFGVSKVYESGGVDLGLNGSGSLEFSEDGFGRIVQKKEDVSVASLDEVKL